MSAVDASIIFVPRFTGLVGATEFKTAPIDVSRYGGAQFQVWRGPLRLASGTGEVRVYFEESLDTLDWVLGPNTPQPFVIAEDTVQLFSYSFRLRWFRMRFELTGTDPIVTAWAEGLLRGGGGGAWPVPAGSSANASAASGPASVAGGGGAAGGGPLPGMTIAPPPPVPSTSRSPIPVPIPALTPIPIDVIDVRHRTGGGK